MKNSRQDLPATLRVAPLTSLHEVFRMGIRGGRQDGSKQKLAKGTKEELLWGYFSVMQPY
jgi:hypothetical protein